ncbi:MAG TPA: methylmalonyl-CoA epimerase [bacterium]|nr:methylmalonyl-CoA epimerase [bacterium]
MGNARLAHLGVIVHRLDTAQPFYARLGLSPARRESLDRERVRVTFLPVADAEIELLEPAGPEGPLSRFLAARGEGIHHIAFEVDDIERALAIAVASGMRAIDQVPRPGAHGTRVAFLHPGSAHGILLELVERPQP